MVPFIEDIAIDAEWNINRMVCYSPELLHELYDRPMLLSDVMVRVDGTWAKVPVTDRLFVLYLATKGTGNNIARIEGLQTIADTLKIKYPDALADNNESTTEIMYRIGRRPGILAVMSEVVKMIIVKPVNKEHDIGGEG